MAERGWGYWTEAKLDILTDYLPSFAIASKQARHLVYLDLFAGNASNQRRDKPTDIKGSAIRALEALPSHTDLIFFELPSVASQLEARLRTAFPDRSFKVIPGDCNQWIDDRLRRLTRDGRQRAPAFAFVDPYSSSALHWSTLEKLADFKRDLRYKVELWILFYGSDIPRVLGLGDEATASQLSRTYGCDDWQPIAAAREAGDLDAAAARFEYTNLLRWRIENALGYERTHSLEIRNTAGNYLYDLIFATDHPAGDRIMSHIYQVAASRNEQMRREALEIRREQRSGQPRLFELPEEGDSIDSELYRPAPPLLPYGRRIAPGGDG